MPTDRRMARVHRRGRPWSLASALALERQRDEVAERAFGHEVLGRKEAVVAREVELRTDGHRLAQQVCADPAGDRRGHRTCEEDPHMGAVAGAGTLDGGLDAQRSRRVLVGPRVERPARSVEVRNEQPAGVVGQERVQTDMDAPGEVPLDHRVGQGEILTVRAFRVGGPADHGRAPARLPGPRVVPTECVDIVAPREQGTEQRDLLVGSMIWRRPWAGLVRRLRTASPQALEPAQPKEARLCPQRRLAHPAACEAVRSRHAATRSRAGDRRRVCRRSSKCRQSCFRAECRPPRLTVRALEWVIAYWHDLWAADA